ncbi:MAG: helix-turn-helix domain-containing protein [Wujia sp.]
MNFAELLIELCQEISCSQKKLSDVSGLSTSVISRYISGERTPSIGSEQIRALANGLEILAKEANQSGKTIDPDKYTARNLISMLEKPLQTRKHDYESFIRHFNRIIEHFDIHMKSMANDTSFDVSYIYRVRSGERRPVELGRFCSIIADYIVKKYSSPADIEKACTLLSCDAETLQDTALYHQLIVDYLTADAPPEPAAKEGKASQIQGFLQKMDEFDLDEYIRVIHFDELKIPTLPVHLPTSKTYYGLEEMRKAELDFFKTTVTSKTSEPIFMCSDMPMTEMAEDMDFNKKWMFAIAASIKKGLHINIVHDVERPFEELMLGFEAWIPIYMTGQVSPYHFPGYKNTTFRQLNYCSGVAALHGECIEGFHDDGKYYLTNNKTELAYYKKKCENILSQAKPLMDIYTEDKSQDFTDYIDEMAHIKKDWRSILSNLPLHTMPEALLKDMICNLSSDKQQRILDCYKKEIVFMNTILADNHLSVDMMEMSEEEFSKHPMRLFLSNAFVQDSICYTYEQYRKHLKATKEYADCNPNYSLHIVEHVPFHNIQIHIIKGTAVIISKAKTPIIHFVIKYPTMVKALERFQIARIEAV